MRTTSAPPAPTVEVLADAVRAPPKLTRLAPVSSPDRRTKALALNFDDVPNTRPSLSRKPPRLARAKRMASFACGLVLGGIVVSAARGDFQSARAWSANALRSLKKNPTTQPIEMPRAQSEAAAAAMAAPCTNDSEDPCAILMAPFKDYPETTGAAAQLAPDVPLVAIDDLPKVKPPVVWVPRAAPPAESAAQPDVTAAVIATVASAADAHAKVDDAKLVDIAGATAPSPIVALRTPTAPMASGSSATAAASAPSVASATASGAASTGASATPAAAPSATPLPAADHAAKQPVASAD